MLLMIENTARIAFMEGPQGAGKTSATEFASTLGYKPVRGIPTGERLIKNTTSQNWHQSLAILENLTNKGESFVSDRSFWSLVVFKMRKRPDLADLYYERGSQMFKGRINGIDYKVIVILAEPQTCISRANPDSPVAITNIAESENEIKAYSELITRLKDDGFKAFSIYNEGISKEEFFGHISSLLK
jgi:hypothetical protein